MIFQPAADDYCCNWFGGLHFPFTAETPSTPSWKCIKKASAISASRRWRIAIS